MPAIDLTTLPGTLVRPFVVAIAHLPIVVVVVLMSPVWVWAAVRPRTIGSAALKYLDVLRSWSVEVVAGSATRRTPPR